MISTLPSVNARRVRTAACAGMVAILVFSVVLQAREPNSEVDRMSTLERIAQPGWWPTKLLPTQKDFVGSEACAQCHASIVASAKGSEMANALLRPADSDVLRTREGQSFRLESFVYKLEHAPHGYQYSVSQGTDAASQPITWAFGDGIISQVYVTLNQGTYYESHFSYFGGISGFDRTTNQPRPAETVQSAVGRIVMPEETRRCFAGHATAVTAEGGFNDVIPVV